MYNIRFHGRGGQGIKTAGRLLGTAFFLENFEVQDAPRYGAERRGAPIFAYVRASRKVINERGIIRSPDLIIVADDSLIPIPAAGILQGVRKHTVILINSTEKAEIWRDRLNIPGQVITLPLPEKMKEQDGIPFIGAMCAGAASRLVGVISLTCLQEAVRTELAPLGEEVVKKNLEKASEAFDLTDDHSGCVAEGEMISAENYKSPDWVDMPFEDARVSAPAIHAPATSVEVKTGLWRTMGPVIDYSRCNRCWWICSTFCPDSAISLDNEAYPQIDYGHCKGCMICVARCPQHVIEAIPEKIARAAGGQP